MVKVIGCIERRITRKTIGRVTRIVHHSGGSHTNGNDTIWKKILDTKSQITKIY